MFPWLGEQICGMAQILLIEDDERLRGMLRDMLAAMGHRVDEAANGRAGLTLFQRKAPDLVITDLLMPEMEGIETIQALKCMDPAVKIVAMSGGGLNSPGSYLDLAKKLGAAVTLTKPFSRQKLEAVLAEVLPGAANARSFTFLVLDDDANLRLLNRCLLENEFPRCTVIECDSIENALDASVRRVPDAVITDHYLGGSEGGEFVRRLRSRGASCPILMVTGSSDPQVHERAYAAGASRVFFGRNTQFTGYLRGALDKADAV